MSGDNELSDDGILEHVAAVAAAVFAVHSVNEDQSEIATRKINSDRRDRETSSSAKIKYIKDDDTRPLAPRPAPDPSKVSRRPSSNFFFAFSSPLKNICFMLNYKFDL